MTTTNPEKIRILGIDVDNLTLGQAVLEVERLGREAGICRQIATVNPEFLVEARKNKKFRQALNNASLCLADGAGLLWAAKKRGESFSGRVTGADLCEKLFERRKVSFYLLGGAPGVAKKAANHLIKKYPGLKILGATDGGKITDNNWAHQQKLIEHINALSVDILLVALGAPKQDLFIQRWQKQLKCRVAIGVGGTFDYIIGQPRRAPSWMRKLYLEWLWRLIKDPRRLGRIFRAVIVFPLLVLFSKKT